MQFNQKFRSKNFDNRPYIDDISTIIIHYTEIDFDDTIKKFCDESENSRVSAHFLIRKDGEIFSLIDEEHRAWHAGVSNFKSRENYNDFSIGIEIDNNGEEEFTSEIYTSLIDLCKYLVDKYDIKQDAIYGHSDIAPARKIDPGIMFNWRLMYNFGLGMYFPEIFDNIEEKYQKIFEEKFCSLEVDFRDDAYSKDLFNIQKKLYELGYDIDISGVFDSKTNFAFRAFQSHFNPEFIFNFYDTDKYRDYNSIYLWNYKSSIFLDKIFEKKREEEIVKTCF